MPKPSESNSSHEKPPLWLRFLADATRFVVYGYASVRETRRRIWRQSAGYLALLSLLTHRPVYEYDIDWDTAEEDYGMIHIICAACKRLIGTLDNEDNLDEDATAIANAHADYCQATEEQEEQAIIDIQFREMTDGFGQ